AAPAKWDDFLMHQDDPGKRIAELERRLAPPRDAGDQEVTEEPPAESYPPLRGMKIQPNLFLFWTPVWHDWRTSGGGTADTSSDSGNLVVDLIWTFLAVVLFERLWNWFLWAVW